jgi:hypothetical protein
VISASPFFSLPFFKFFRFTYWELLQLSTIQGGIVLMDALCGTSSLWLYPVPALEPSYNRNGKQATIIPSMQI